MDDFPPNPPSLKGVENGWLEPDLTRLAESCARQGAMAAIKAHRRLPTVAEAHEAARASSHLAYEPDWEHHLAQVELDDASFLTVCLKTEHALDDDINKLYVRLAAFWQQHEPGRRSRAAAAAMHQFLTGLTTPTLLVLKAVVDSLDAAAPSWDVL